MSSRLVFISLFYLGLFGAPAVAEMQLPDPMRPPAGIGAATGGRHGGGAAVAAGYELNSILIAQGRRSAIINGKLVAEGEHIGAARVVAIGATEVVLLLDGRHQTLSLLPLSIKKPVEALPR